MPYIRLPYRRGNIKWLLRNHGPITKPELWITETSGGIPIQGTCSSWRDVTFSTGSVIGTKADNQAALELLFLVHCNKVHQREGAGQAERE